ncbi:MAG: M56 family metallopeptidase [Oscillospiraceae bacterium]|jgi:beta-lactamase regulating signal transducer with metallopeptidase domain|nr:M56 family metallopeptidase [Oscillospiraceae bacterium]
MNWWEQLSELTRTLVIMSLTGSVIAAVFFLLKPLLRNRLPKALLYYRWLLVIAALLVPVPAIVTLPVHSDLPTISGVLQDNLISGYEYEHRQLLTETGLTIPDTAEEFKQFEYEEISQIINVQQKTNNIKFFLNWLVLQVPLYGILIQVINFLFNYFRFKGKLKTRNTAASSYEQAALAELSGERRIPGLFRNPLAGTPMLIGVFRPVIILPDKEYTEEQLRSVLLHELTHLRRKDVLIKWLMVLVCSLHWFNPVVWLVRREIDRAAELSCDEAVIRSLDDRGKRTYGETLLYVAADFKAPRAVLSATMCEEKRQLKERLGAIMKNKRYTKLAVILSAILVIAVAAAACALGAVSNESAPPLIPGSAATAVASPAAAATPVTPASSGDVLADYEISKSILTGGAVKAVEASLAGKEIAYMAQVRSFSLLGEKNVTLPSGENAAYVFAAYRTAPGANTYEAYDFVLERADNESDWEITAQYPAEYPVTAISKLEPLPELTGVAALEEYTVRYQDKHPEDYLARDEYAIFRAMHQENPGAKEGYEYFTFYFGLIDKDKNIIFTPGKFNGIIRCENGFIIYGNYFNGLYEYPSAMGLMDKDGNVLVEPRYHLVTGWDAEANTVYVWNSDETEEILGTLNIATGEITPFPQEKIREELGIPKSEFSASPHTLELEGKTVVAATRNAGDGPTEIHFYEWDGTPYTPKYDLDWLGTNEPIANGES